MTIVGVERQIQDGEINLLVFDPTYRDSDRILRLRRQDEMYKSSIVEEELRAYRRGSKRLRKFGAFEVL